MGTRGDYSVATNSGEDHPHAYGDKHRLLLSQRIQGGSSPRVWGQGVSRGILLCACRIIPTRMGTSCRHSLTLFRCVDHPHAYGDKLSNPFVLSMTSGSSPRVWGQGILILPVLKSDRIIPTRMGTRLIVYLSITLLSNHPHAYGDKIEGGIQIALALGSSPRVWGQADKPCLIYSFAGIIPTRMGTRSSKNALVLSYQDHPHAYGDKVISNNSFADSLGSSPRVWGQDERKIKIMANTRIIPTRMGTSTFNRLF